MEDYSNHSNSSCSLPFTKGQARVLLLTYASIGAGTVFICIFGIVVVFSLKLHKIYVYRLAMYQVMAAGFFGFTRALQLMFLADLGEEGNEMACKVVAYLVVCSSWIKLTLTLWVTVHLFVYTVFLKNLRRMEVFYVVTAVLVGPLIASVPLFTDSYGHAGAWCWIKGHKHRCDQHKKFAIGEIQQIGVWYGPALIVLLVESVLVLVTVGVSIYRISCKAWSDEYRSLLHATQNRQRQALHLLLPLLTYPILFCVLITIPLGNRIYEIAETTPNFGLFMASAVSIPTMGLAAGIALLAHIAFVKRHTLPKPINYFGPSVRIGRNHTNQQQHRAEPDDHNDNRQSFTSSEKPQRSTSPSCMTQYIMIRESEVDGTHTDEELSLPCDNQ